LFKPGQKVLDLGAAPGSWTMFAASRVGSKGHVTALDLNPITVELPPNVEFRVQDVLSPGPEFLELLEQNGPFDLVISDMAPKTTGVKFADQARSMELAGQALALAAKVLVNGGRLVVKIFQGPEEQEFSNRVRALFSKVKTYKPKSSRSESKEIFLIGLGFTGQQDSIKP